MADDEDEWLVLDTSAGEEEDDAPTLATPAPGTLQRGMAPAHQLQGGAPVPLAAFDAAPGGSGSPWDRGVSESDVPTTARPNDSRDSGERRKKGVLGSRRVKLPPNPLAGGAGSGSSGPVTPQPMSVALGVTPQPLLSSSAPAARPGPLSPPQATPQPGPALPPGVEAGFDEASLGPTLPQVDALVGGGAGQPPPGSAASAPAASAPAAPVPAAPVPAVSVPPGSVPADDPNFDPFVEDSFSSFNQPQGLPLEESGSHELAAGASRPAGVQGSVADQATGMVAAQPTGGALSAAGSPVVSGALPVAASGGLVGLLLVVVVAGARALSCLHWSTLFGELTRVPIYGDAWLHLGAEEIAQSLFNNGWWAFWTSATHALSHHPSPVLSMFHTSGIALFGESFWAPFAGGALGIALLLVVVYSLADRLSTSSRVLLLLALTSLPVAHSVLTTLAPEPLGGAVLGAAVMWLMASRGPRSRAQCFGFGALAGLGVAIDPGHLAIALVLFVVAALASIGLARFARSRQTGELVQHVAVWVGGLLLVALPTVIPSAGYAMKRMDQGLERASSAGFGAKFSHLFTMVVEGVGWPLLVVGGTLTLLALFTERRGGPMAALARQGSILGLVLLTGLMAAAMDGKGGPSGYLFVGMALAALVGGAIAGLQRLPSLLGEGLGPTVPPVLTAALALACLVGHPHPNADRASSRQDLAFRALVDDAYAAVRHEALTSPRLAGQRLQVGVSPMPARAGTWVDAAPHFRRRARQDGLPADVVALTDSEVYPQIAKSALLVGWIPAAAEKHHHAATARKAADRAHHSPYLKEIFRQSGPRETLALVHVRVPTPLRPAAAPKSETAKEAKGGTASAEPTTPAASATSTSSDGTPTSGDATPTPAAAVKKKRPVKKKSKRRGRR